MGPILKCHVTFSVMTLMLIMHLLVNYQLIMYLLLNYQLIMSLLLNYQIIESVKGFELFILSSPASNYQCELMFDGNVQSRTVA